MKGLFLASVKSSGNQKQILLKWIWCVLSPSTIPSVGKESDDRFLRLRRAYRLRLVSLQFHWETPPHWALWASLLMLIIHRWSSASRHAGRALLDGKDVGDSAISPPLSPLVGEINNAKIMKEGLSWGCWQWCGACGRPAEPHGA